MTAKVYVPLDRPKLFDNDRGSILIYFRNEQIRGWSYQSPDERRKKMGYAREYIEGWIEGCEHGKSVGHDEGYTHGYNEGAKSND